MQPLLRIQNVPINIQYTTKRAQLRQNSEQPRAEVSRIRGKQEIRSDPARVKIDSYEMRASMGIKSARRSIEEYAQTGRTDAVRGTSRYVQEGYRVLDSHGKGNPIADIAMTRVMSSYETIMTFIPSVRPEMQMEGGTVSFDYTPDRLDYNWQLQVRPELEFVPGSIDFTVSQYPQVIIEYLGGPIYAPPSADPNYSPPPELDLDV